MTAPNLGAAPRGRSLGRMKVAALIAVLAAAGCATLGPGPGPSMGCLDPLDKACDDPSAYSPLVAQLPPWPFPKLLVPLSEGDHR